ncbi:MAG: nucleotidyltransferase domain-containing protein [Candidatus Omnitrophota bacterium]
MSAENKYLEKLKQLTLSVLAGEKVKIVLFGSRGRRDNRPASDVDIGLIPDGKLDRNKLLLLKEKIEDLNLPYKVEVVDFSQTSEDFKEEALKGAIVWKDYN